MGLEKNWEDLQFSLAISAKIGNESANISTRLQSVKRTVGISRIIILTLHQTNLTNIQSETLVQPVEIAIGRCRPAASISEPKTLKVGISATLDSNVVISDRHGMWKRFRTRKSLYP